MRGSNGQLYRISGLYAVAMTHRAFVSTSGIGTSVWAARGYVSGDMPGRQEYPIKDPAVAALTLYLYALDNAKDVWASGCHERVSHFYQESVPTDYDGQI